MFKMWLLEVMGALQGSQLQPALSSLTALQGNRWLVVCQLRSPHWNLDRRRHRTKWLFVASWEAVRGGLTLAGKQSAQKWLCCCAPQVCIKHNTVIV